jgi:hypothetical protein
VLAGVAGAILAGVFICGGKFKVGLTGVEIETPGIGTLGKTIESLRAAIVEDKAVPLGYGARPRTIQLTPDEVSELKKPTSGSGGFQRLMKRLRSQVTKDGEITLAPEDIQKIKKHVSEGGGGFQERLRKVFGNHLEL